MNKGETGDYRVSFEKDCVRKEKRGGSIDK